MLLHNSAADERSYETLSLILISFVSQHSAGNIQHVEDVEPAGQVNRIELSEVVRATLQSYIYFIYEKINFTSNLIFDFF